jgi:hypothetical protein
MRITLALSILLLIAGLWSGCAQTAEMSTNNSNPSAVNTNTKSVTSNTETTGTSNNNSNSTATTTTAEGKAPVEFTFSGLSPDKEQVNYRIKVTTDKPIKQVDLAAKYMDDKGKVLEETTVVWQNIVRAKREPIEKGKTYDATGFVEPGATKVEYKLARVVFEDGSTWSAR